MHTELSEQYGNTKQGKIASDVIAKCVHCGFCNATCPTYQLLGDELDGPRGRIYLIKQVFEGEQPSLELAQHLDRCLSCRNCETTCPSGVEYHRLLDVGREVIEPKIKRSHLIQLKKWLIRKTLSQRKIMSPLMFIAQNIRPILPAFIKTQIPKKQFLPSFHPSNKTRKMLMLEGCVQPSMKPGTNFAVKNVLDKLDICVLTEKKEVCCGALNFHLDAQDEAKIQMRRNIDVWWPYVEQGVEAIISSASGCGLMVKDYEHLFAHDVQYFEKAKRISELTKDISEVIRDENLEALNVKANIKVAFHPPCTLQHGQKQTNVVESILTRSGFTLTTITDSHLCCGSAGTYSIFQPELSQQLKHNKITAIEDDRPQIIATANIGCQLHLEGATQLPVVHWIELLDSHSQF